MFNPYYNYNSINPYGNYNSISNLFSQQPQQTQPSLPQQQVIQVNGKSSVDTINLPPNSSVLLMDTSAPMVWLCVSDGVGKVSSQAFDITPHQEKPPIDVSGIETRLQTVENTLAQIMEGLNRAKQSNARNAKSKQNSADSDAD